MRFVCMMKSFLPWLTYSDPLVRLFDADPDLDDRRRPDILIRNPRDLDRQVILDVAVTGVDMFGRVAYDDPYKPLEDRYKYKQKINKYLRVADQNGL